MISSHDPSVNSPPRVSIITPSFNQGRFIRKTIESVLSQNYPCMEYVVIDGGSKDHTLDILKQYDKRLTWISQKDRGQADAVRKGTRMTTGEIISWLNADDILLPGAVERVVACFQRYPGVALVYGMSNYIDKAGKVIGRYPTEHFDHERLAAFNFIAQPSAFFLRTAYDGVGEIDEKLRYSLDFDLWIRIGRSFPVRYLPWALSNYRLHPGSKTMDPKQALANHRESLETVLRHYNWAPVNRVYGYCYHLVESKMPGPERKKRLMTLILALLISVPAYLHFNRGIRLEDIRALTFKNIRKILMAWEDLYKTY